MPAVDLINRITDPRDDEGSWRESYRLPPLQFYLQVGGSLDHESDPQSPFDAFLPRGKAPAYGRSSMRVLRRSRV